ncbi:MAG: response regulator [Azonexus sp.]
MRVYVVDDDQVFLDALSGILEGVCQLETFNSVDTCLIRLADAKPDIFLLDIQMPVTDGYAFCCRLKDDFDTLDIPVLFVSSSDESETLLLCYEAGGDDFIRKPVDPTVLVSKLAVASRMLAEKKALREQAGYARDTAMAAMVSMGELGVVLQFLSKSFICNSLQELAALVIDSMGQYDLLAAVQVRLGDDVLTLSQDGQNVPLEVSVLNLIRDSGRVFQFRSRCVFNFGRVTLLVNNMPLADAERCGRIRDNCAILAEGADARLKAIESDLLAHRRRVGIEAALPRLYATLDGVQNNYRRNCFELTQVMIDFEEKLNETFNHLDLMSRQEEELGKMANAFMLRVVGTQDASLEIVGRLEGLADDLKDLLRN